MTTANLKRQHHVNPKFYLRAFEVEGKEGYVWRYDSVSGEAIMLSTCKAARQRDYNSHVNADGLLDTEFVENFIGDVEGIVAPVLKKSLAGDELNDEERTTFAYFVALSWLRAPAARRQAAEMIGAL